MFPRGLGGGGVGLLTSDSLDILNGVRKFIFFILYNIRSYCR